MKYSGILYFSFLFACTCIKAQPFEQNNYPQGYFRNPLGIPIQLSGNFGELRSNHFHMGLDMRTNQRENLPVYAAADGYVSRIKIEQYGFGRAIYITHPNGYTTLYAHLNDFYPALNEHLKTVQYQSQQWEQELFFEPGMFPVTKGQFIANSGNTGGSGGPHLHFEIRNTKTERNLNPMLFGMGIPDGIPPQLYQLAMYDRRYSTYQAGPSFIKVKGTQGNYTSVSKVVITQSPAVSFGIGAEDKTNNSFKFGIYEAELSVDDSLRCAFKMDDILYDDSRYINGSIDYMLRAKGGAYIQHLSRLPGNQSSIFENIEGNGVLLLEDTLRHAVLITLKDAAGNATVVRFIIQYKPAAKATLAADTNSINMLPGQPNELKAAEAEAIFSDRTFYHAVPFAYRAAPTVQANIVSQLHYLHNYTVPVHDSFVVRLQMNTLLPPDKKEKVVMQMISNRKKEAIKGTWNNDWMEAKFIDLGIFKLLLDTIPPTLVPAGWKNGTNLRSAANISFVAKDDVGDLLRFRAELDGEWLMFSRKSDYFIHRFDEHTSAGSHQLRVWVTDQAGNVTEKLFTFSR